MLKVSDNRRYLVHDDGRPFFYLADTCWELFHRLNREEAELLIKDRAVKGFTAIQAVALAELDGIRKPNVYGHSPLREGDPAQPVEEYWQHVDFIVDACNRAGMFMAMLPTWGDKWNRKFGAGPELFTPDNARPYGNWIGQRYRDRDIIWVLGGDRSLDTDEHHGIIRAMAEGIREAVGNRHLITLHPNGGATSSAYVHNEPWLDFNMMQSGHGAMFIPNWKMVRKDRALSPTKPTLDGEPCYENHPVAFTNGNRPLLVFQDYHVRLAAYWSVFAGACGVTYGCHDIWMMRSPSWQPIDTADGYWYESIHLPGSRQYGYVRRLMESRPYVTRIPDYEVSDKAAIFESEHTPVTRDGSEDASKRDATYIMMYSPLLRGWTSIDTTALRGERMKVWRYNPRTGESKLIDERKNEGKFSPPWTSEGPDWVWVLDAADTSYPPPGTKLEQK